MSGSLHPAVPDLAAGLLARPPATEVDLNFGEEGFFLRARLNVALPGLDRGLAQRLVDEAHRTCPYSKALKAGIDITVTLV